MNPDTRMALSLVLSLALSATNLRMAAEGRADIVVVGLRYIVGFVICFTLVGIVGRLFNTYLTQHGQRDLKLAGTGGLDSPIGDDGYRDQTAASSDT